MHDVESLPAELDAARVREWIEGLSSRPQRQLYDVQGKPVPAKAIDGFMDALNLKAIPGTQETRYGLVVPRADLRTLPATRSEEHTSELQSLMRISYAVFRLNKKNT